MNIQNIINKLNQFRDERNWKQFHTQENLAKSIVIEATELLEIYQWNSNNNDIIKVKEELADIVNYCLLMADSLDIDIIEAMTEKIKKNEKKYPVDKAYGTSKKYDKLK